MTKRFFIGGIGIPFPQAIRVTKGVRPGFLPVREKRSVRKNADAPCHAGHSGAEIRSRKWSKLK
jgi:hypothetical protein